MIVSSVEATPAKIEVHCGTWKHDVEQAMQLSRFPNVISTFFIRNWMNLAMYACITFLLIGSQVKIHTHPVDDHRLAKYLKVSNELEKLIAVAVGVEFSL